jgi:trimeric autotransporter adhesin
MSGGWLPDNKNFAISGHWGTFQGQNAGAVAAYLRVSDNIVLDGAVGAGFRYGVGGRAGATFGW